MLGEVFTLVHTSIEMHFYLAAAHSKNDGKGMFKTLKSYFFESWCKGEAACSGPWNSGDSGMQNSRQYLPSTMAIIFQPWVRATTTPSDQLSRTSLPEYSVSCPSDRGQEPGLQVFPSQCPHNACLNSPHCRKSVR